MVNNGSKHALFATEDAPNHLENVNIPLTQSKLLESNQLQYGLISCRFVWFVEWDFNLEGRKIFYDQIAGNYSHDHFDDSKKTSIDLFWYLLCFGHCVV